MRDIEFKGLKVILDENDNWIQTKEWVFGSFVEVRRKGHHFMINETYSNESIHVNPESVCQYIGLIDVTGKRIFENDTFGNEILLGIVERSEDGAYVVRFPHQLMKGSVLSILDPVVRRSEITGNIHSNETA